MDSFVDARDFALLSRDRYTFSVLDRILRGPCARILTDHERLILCLSERRYPVWIWTPDGLSEGEKERAWRLAADAFPLTDGYRYNIKYELADYMMAKGRALGLKIGYFMQLYAYDCPAERAPAIETDGYLYRCTPDDLEEAAGLLARFRAEVGEDPLPREVCLEQVRAWIDNRAFHFWKDGAGKTAACCGYRINQGLGSLGPVYTLPEARRKHYAQHLVYRVTQLVRGMGYVPMLYTDANYPASNACYEKVGYVLRGRLCTIAATDNLS